MQALHRAPEFTDVGGHDDQAAAARMGGDQGVERTDRRLAERNLDATVPISGIPVMALAQYYSGAIFSAGGTDPP